MSGTAGYRVSIGGLVLYLILATVFLAVGDGEHALMFLAGAIIWIFTAFIWNRVHEQGE
jgi:hypothetical protein